MTRIVLLAEAQGEAEARHHSTLIGASGIELLRMMAEAEMIHLSPVDRDLIHRYYFTNDNRHIMALWDNHPEVYRTNVFNHHPPGNWLGWFLGPKSEALPGYPSLKIPTGAGKPKPAGPFVRKEFANELARLGMIYWTRTRTSSSVLETVPYGRSVDSAELALYVALLCCRALQSPTSSSSPPTIPPQSSATGTSDR